MVGPEEQHPEDPPRPDHYEPELTDQFRSTNPARAGADATTAEADQESIPVSKLIHRLMPYGSAYASPTCDAPNPDVARARATVRGVTILQIVANSIGVIAVFAYFRFLYPPSEQAGLNGQSINLVAFGTYLAVMVLLATPLNILFIRRAMCWVRDGTKPTERQRKLLFSLPLTETISALVSWFGASILFSIVNESAGRIGIGIALAGMVTCTLLYLLLEGHFRPVYALALKDADAPADRRDVLPRLMLAWLMGSAVPLIAIGLSPVISPVPLNASRLGWLAVGSAAAGGLVMGVAARSVARPLHRIREALKQIESGNLQVHVPLDDLGELGRLAEGVNDLATGMREQKALRSLFERQVGQADLADLDINHADLQSSSTRRAVTVLFVDLRGYTRFAETRPPEDVVHMLNSFFGVVVAAVSREGGWINKFEGDAALCLFGAPQDQPDHADRALRAAAALPADLRQVSSVLSAGIGVATGEVIAGFIGTAERFEYTVIGDVVNLASRLCDEAKETPSGVLASDSTISAASNKSDWTPMGSLSIRGRQAKASVFTLREPQSRRSRRYGTTRSSRPERSAP